MTTRVFTLHPDQYHPVPEKDNVNLNWPERYTSVIAGLRLGYIGFKELFNKPFASIVKLGAGGYLLNRGITGHCGLYKRMEKYVEHPENINIRSSFIVHKPRTDVYAFWRKLDNLPLFMKHLKSVKLLNNDKSHWVLKLPKGIPNIGWDAEIVKDKPNEMIGWSSVEGSIIEAAGKIRFRDSFDGDGTIVDVMITYQPPAGNVGASIARVFTPMFKRIVEQDVQNFKQFMEIDYAEDSINYL